MSWMFGADVMITSLFISCLQTTNNAFFFFAVGAQFVSRSYETSTSQPLCPPL